MILTDDERLRGTRWEDKSICQKCGGTCCQRCACNASPFDFDNNMRIMEAALRTGNYSIDLARDPHLTVFKMVNGFWTRENGCKLPYEERPKYGRAMVPISSGNCTGIFTRNMLLGEWHPYAEFLYQMGKKFLAPTWPLNRFSHFNF